MNNLPIDPTGQPSRAPYEPLGVSVLGSTGSVGSQTLDVIRRQRERFKIVALAAGANMSLLAEQVKEFSPELVAVGDDSAREAIMRVLPPRTPVVVGRDGLETAATAPSADAVMVAVTGYAALPPLLAALRAGKHVTLANKESLVAAGSLVRREAAASGASIIPVDSEHNSIFQCLRRRGVDEPVRKVILTASGGPFLKTPVGELSKVTPAEAVRHPRWNMGAKISVDSATLMNKGLEVIEAAMLFGLPPSQIEVLIHPESLVHGLVEFGEGSVLAALYQPDMRIPIAYALDTVDRLRGAFVPVHTGNECSTAGATRLDLCRAGQLTFLPVDYEKFRCLRLCYDALAADGGSPAVVNAANEVAVAAFLEGEVPFTGIPDIVERVLNKWTPTIVDSFAMVEETDRWGRETARAILRRS